MAITLTPAELAAALRLGDAPEETAEATRLLAYATEAVSRHLGPVSYASTPDAIVNEAARRLAGYLYDAPFAASEGRYSNAMRYSGAASALLPYRTHRASTGAVDRLISCPRPGE